GNSRPSLSNSALLKPRSPRVPNVNVDLLKRLCEVPGVPGREERVRALIEKEVKGLFDEMHTDTMGSLICRRGPRPAKGKKLARAKGSGVGRNGRPTRVMHLCHMD